MEKAVACRHKVRVGWGEGEKGCLRLTAKGGGLRKEGRSKSGGEGETKRVVVEEEGGERELGEERGEGDSFRGA